MIKRQIRKRNHELLLSSCPIAFNASAAMSGNTTFPIAVSRSLDHWLGSCSSQVESSGRASVCQAVVGSVRISSKSMSLKPWRRKIEKKTIDNINDNGFTTITTRKDAKRQCLEEVKVWILRQHENSFTPSLEPGPTKFI